eukprot:2011585-Amphidinium_carterae.1
MKGSGLPSLKLRTFSGQRKEYREWKRETQALQLLYQVPAARMATLVYLALEPGPGSPRDPLTHLDVTSEIFCDTGLDKVWAILDEEYVLPDYRRSDEAQSQYDKCHRGFQQSMSDYLQQLRVSKRRLETEDKGTTLSDVAYARNMLRRAGLTREEQRQVLAACGAVWASKAIADALRLMYAEVHLEDRNRVARQHSFRGRGAGAGKGGKGKGNGTYVTEPGPEEEYIEPEVEGDAIPEDLPEAEGDEEADSSEEEDPDEVLETYFIAKQRLEKYKGRFGNGAKASGQGEKKSVEDKKKTSKCADCGRVGHWRGDPTCPKVRSGVTPAYQKKTSTATSSSTLWVGTLEHNSNPCFAVSAKPVVAPKRQPVAAAAAASAIPDEEMDDWDEFEEVSLSPFGVPCRHVGTQTDVVPGFKEVLAIPEEIDGLTLESFTVIQIKQWLRQRGLSVKGNKTELIARMWTSREPEQVECPHEHVRNGANATHSWKRCQSCQKILFRMCKATGVEEHFIGEDFVGVVQDLVCDVLAVSAEPGTIILDTGCRKSVAGQAWHVQM